MSKLASGFQSLPEEYQHVIQLAQEQHRIHITPLQEMVGGWSGAMVYLVSVAHQDSPRVEHFILKLDRKGKKTRSDEVVRHNLARSLSPSDFASHHIPEIHFDRVDSEESIAIFYAIAGQSLRDYRTLSKYKQQNQLEKIVTATHRYFLSEWNAEPAFEQAIHPQTLLKKWLGFRLDPGRPTEQFMHTACRVDPDSAGFLLRGNVFPNPLRYARTEEPWGSIRPVDALFGLQHGDLNTNNILVKFSKDKDDLEGYYLIDFALFKEGMPLLYDLRYLEISYLLLGISQGGFSQYVDLISQLGEKDILDPDRVPIEMVGSSAVIGASRRAFEQWVRQEHPSLQDDLWGQYWLAGVAAGLSYCHKAGQPDEQRLAGLIYAAANLKRYAILYALSMPEEARQLYDESQYDASARIQSAPGSPSIGTPHNLPIPPTKFVGRGSEVTEITEMLLRPDVRLITLTGPGGTGKTRIELEIGRTLLDHFPDGVYFVDLAAIRDPALVATTVAHTVGMREGGGRPPLEKLKDYLADKHTLLLFDNFEQIIDAATVVADLMAAAPGIKALVTSRIPLQLRGEHEYPISPLALPLGNCRSRTDVLANEAVALFRQQAQSVQPNFEITDENCLAVVEICRRLDGLPLAIEIAAARIKMLQPQALLKRLDQSLKLLVAKAKDLPDRQQTLRRTIDWSYELLEPEAQNLFIRLGIFSGGFTLEAAEGVCNPDEEMDIFSGIETLLISSLLRQVESVSDEPRFDMLQTIRDYALEKLEEAGITAEMQMAHCDYFTQLAQSADVYGSQSMIWLQRLREEHDNYRAALAWAMGHEESIPAAVVMMEPLLWFWFRYGHLQEGVEWTKQIMAATTGMGLSPLRALALVGRAMLAMWSSDLNVAAEHALAAVEMSTQLNFDVGLSMAKLGIGVTLINQGKDKEAFSHLVDAGELFDQQNQSWMKGTALVHLANASLGLGDADQALKWLDMALPLMKDSNDLWNMAFTLNNYGEVSRVKGDYDKAESYYRQTEKLYKQADAVGDQARLVHTLGYIAMHKGEFEEARALFQESLSDFKVLGNQRGIAECLAGLAGLAVEQGEHSWAVPLLAAAESQLKAIGGAWWPADRVEIEHARESMRATLGDEFEKLWEQGQAMDVEEALAYLSTVV
ncbi:MAG: tetratricopeptide repeat protein [Anaerolineales bacterium]